MLALQHRQKDIDSCTANVLPCRIHHDGRTKVTKRYWSPHVEKGALSQCAHSALNPTDIAFQTVQLHLTSEAASYAEKSSIYLLDIEVRTPDRKSSGSANAAH